MKEMTLRRIADVCGGILHIPEGREELASTEVTAIVTDSRKVSEGSLFAAIRGERVDGHSFIGQAFSSGALCVLTEQEVDDAPCRIKVRSTLEALKDIAREYLRVMDVPVVGITGSVGKTSTKEMIASVLSQKYHVHRTKGNFNNELGLPLTVFDLKPEHEIAVLEMGISNFGEMHTLASIARPDTCVITNIGQCHLENLKDRDGVLRAKTEIFDFLPDDGYIVLNGDDDKLSGVKAVHGITPVLYGLAGTPKERFFATDIVPRGLTGVRAVLHTGEDVFEVNIPMPGEHMVMNALAAAAVGVHYGLNANEIKTGIETVQVPGGRFNVISTPRWTVIDDCYNANPQSMRASLRSLAGADSKGKAAILGDMFELGEDELLLHEQLGTFAAGCGLTSLIAAGERCRYLVEAAGKADPSLRTAWFESTQSLLQSLQEESGKCPLNEGDTILVKASHGMHFEEIIRYLTS